MGSAELAITLNRSVAMGYKIYISAVALALVIAVCNCQFAPSWKQSPYIEAKTIAVVSSASKTYGAYTQPITFSGLFPSPILVLAIPSLRISSNSNLNFKSYHSNLAATGFTHNLEIPSPTTTIWYFSLRYMVFNSAILTAEFQSYFVTGLTGINIVNIAATPNGQFRSDLLTVPLTQAAVTADNPVCLPFLAGVAGSSTDYYQLNLTCSIQTSASATVTATAYPSTIITSVSFYLLVWDPVLLSVQSYYFVDSAITTTYYNTQRTFLSLPKGYIDGSYMGGLCSFSYNNNQNLNITLYNFTVATSLTSLYDSVPQFQIRLRYCSNLSPYYNKADGLCYPICPVYTYSNAADFSCNACPTTCKTCLNSTVCTSCSTGMVVSGNTCICSNYSYYWSNSCYGCHYSCLTCTYSGQYYNCLTCDSTSAKRTPIAASGSNFYCSCMTGYTDVGVTICSDICGDGVARTTACDDGNTLSGDGCASDCSIQANFTCTNDANSFSSCFYTGKVTLSLYKIFKVDFENTAIIYLQVTPWISAMSQLANSLSLTSNGSFSSVTYDTFQNYLVYTAAYTETLRGVYVRFDLKSTSSGIFSQLSSTNFTTQMYADDGYKLVAYTDLQYKISVSFQYISYIFGFLILASACLYIFGRLKWVGNLLFFSLQFQYMSMVVIPKFTPILNGLGMIKALMGYNQALGQQSFEIPKYASFFILNFSKKYDRNVNVMVALQALALVMYAIYIITYNRNKVLCRKYGGDPEKTYRSTKYGKLLQFFNWEFFMFWTFLNMTEQITAMVLFSEMIQPEMLPLIAFNAICIVLAILPLLIRRKEVKSYTQLLYYQDRGREQSLVTLTCFILMFVFLAISLLITMVLYYLIFIFPISMIIYLLCRKPFQSKWVRAAYLINNGCIIMTLIYNLLLISFEDDVFYLPFGTYIIIMLDWIFNLVVWGREAYVICKYGGERDLNEILQSKTKTTEKEEVDFFKEGGNQNALNSIIKNSHKKLMLEQGKATRRPLRRNEENQDDQMPPGLQERHQNDLESEQQQQRENLKQKRQKWLKTGKRSNETHQLKQIASLQLQKTQASKGKTLNKLRSTNQKGLDQSKMREADDRTVRHF